MISTAMTEPTNARTGALLNSGTPSPNPWDLTHSRQNVCSTLKALERRIGLRRDATRAPIQERIPGEGEKDSGVNVKTIPG